MNLPRLILADESRPGKIPAGVIIACALKEMGYRLKLFVGGIDETVLRTLEVMCGQSVTMLDPILCDGKANFRWLFQTAASPDCINLVLTNLGARWTEESAFRVPKECFLLAEWLECELIPIVYSDTSSVIAVRSLKEIIGQFEQRDLMRIHGVLFRSVLSNREYEMIDREAGRQLSSCLIGPLPRTMERDQPLLIDIVSDEARQAVLSLRSAAIQLKGMTHQISWPVFSALAQADMKWVPQPALEEPITDAGNVNIAVIRHPALTLGGDGTEHLLRIMGCNVVDIPLSGDIQHNVPIHGVYVPHGLGYMALQKFFGNLYLKTMINRGSTGPSFLLAEGGSSPLLGDRITLPQGYGGGGDARGFGVFPYNSGYAASTFGHPQRLVAKRRRTNPLISGTEEWVWGYASQSLQFDILDEESICWNLCESPEQKPIGVDGWTKGRVLASRMRLEPWSNPEGFRRWLEG